MHWHDFGTDFSGCWKVSNFTRVYWCTDMTLGLTSLDAEKCPTSAVFNNALTWLWDWPQRYLLPVEAYFFSEELMQKKLSLVAFFRKGDNFSSHNLVKIHWWQNNFFCGADVMVSTEGLTQERSVFMLSHFSLCLPCHRIILPRFREVWINFFPKICITLSLLQSASKGTL